MRTEKNCRVIAVANQKGGVGKTVTCVNLGIGLAREGKKVLLIDADPQGSLTISLGYPEPDQMVPFVTVGEGMFSDLDVYSLKEGDTVTLDHEIRIRMDTVSAGEGEEWFYIFTNEDEIHKQPVPDVVMEIPFSDMLDIAGKSDKVAGVVINPFGKYFKADKKVIECIFEVCRNMEE